LSNVPSTNANEKGTLTIANVKNDSTTIDHVEKDEGDSTYIDFDTEFTNLIAANEELAKNALTPDIDVESDADFEGQKDAAAADENDYTYGDMNNRTIDVSTIDKKAIVIKIKASVISNNTKLNIIGLEGTADNVPKKSVFIIVDTEGESTEVAFNAQVHLYYTLHGADGSLQKSLTSSGLLDKAGNAEFSRNNTDLMDFTDSTILWSFSDTTTTDDQVTVSPVTKLTMENAFMGSILAPSASVESGQNIQGSVICDTFLGSGSLYRWDWQGKYSPTVTNSSGNLVIEKYDYDSGKQIISENTENPTDNEEKISDEDFNKMNFTLNKVEGDTKTPVALTDNFTASLSKGTYELQETSSPGGYIIGTDGTSEPVTFDVTSTGDATDKLIWKDPNGKDQLVVENGVLHYKKYDKRYTLNLEKLDSATDTQLTGKDLNGLEFKIVGANDKETYVKQIDEKVYISDWKDNTDTNLDSVTINATGWSLPLADGNYKITEVQAPEGYAVENSESTFTVDKDGITKLNPTGNDKLSLNDTKDTITFKKYDKKLPTLTINKYDNWTGDAIPLESDNGGSMKFTVTKYKDLDHKDIETTEEMDSTTGLTTNGLIDGYYSVAETQAPSNYELEATPFYFEIKDHKIVEEVSLWNNAYAAQAEKTKDTDSYQDTMFKDNSDNLFFQKFDTFHKKLTVFKYDKTTGKRVTTIDGLDIELFRYEDSSFTTRKTIGNTTNSPLIGNIFLSPGFYGLKEVAAPAGYNIEPTEFKFSYQSNGKIVAADGSSVASWKYIDESDGTYNSASNGTLFVDQGNIYFQKFDLKKKSIDFTKYDKQSKQELTDDKLSGIEFHIESTDKKEGSAGYINKEISAASLTKNELSLGQGTYTITEKASPTGYNLDDTPYTFTIDENGKVTSSDKELAKLSDAVKDGVATTNEDGLYLDGDNNLVFQKFDTKTPVVLPHTGGSGRLTYIAIGVAALISSGIIYFRRKSNEQEVA
jgi:LPXTG-motif cell wall-anchored protein